MRKGSGTKCVVEAIELRLLLSTIYVDANAPGAVQDGTAWPTAYQSLQSGLNAAASGDDIHVADGTYKPTNTTDRTATFQLKSGVAVIGGYAGYGAVYSDARDAGLFPTILSGDIGTIGNNTDNSYHVVTGTGTDATAVLDGVTVRDGNANAFSGPPYSYGGAGLDCVFSGCPTIRNCTFSANVSDGDGGAVFVGTVSPAPSFTNCTFLNNSARFTAGAVSIYSSSVTMTNCTFINNSAQSISRGGAVFIDGGGSSVLTNCVFAGNHADSGGAVEGGPVTLINCEFVGNIASDQGGAISCGPSCAMVNCDFSKNSAGQFGGAVYDANGSASVANSILWDNVAPTGAQVYVDPTYGSVLVTSSDVQGGWPGSGNINVDPKFVRNPDPGLDAIWGTADDDAGNLHLQVGSACVDAGNNGSVPVYVTLDMDRSARFADVPGVNDPGAIVDMGAYERQVSLNVVNGTFNTDSPAGPWINIAFSNFLDASSVSPSDLVVRAVLSDGSLGAIVSVASAGADPAGKSAGFTLPITTPDGNYRATLLAGSVTDVYGNVTTSDYAVNFFILHGDANHDRSVNILDLYALGKGWAGTGMAFSQGDFDYNGKVDSADLGILTARWQQTLSPPPPPSIASLTTSARRLATRVVTLIS